MNLNIWGDFQMCISVPLTLALIATNSNGLRSGQLNFAALMNFAVFMIAEILLFAYQL